MELEEQEGRLKERVFEGYAGYFRAIGTPQIRSACQLENMDSSGTNGEHAFFAVKEFAEGERGFSFLTPRETLDLRWIERTNSLHALPCPPLYVRASSGVEQLPDSVLHAVVEG